MIHLRVEVFVIPEKPSEGEDYYVFIYLFKLPPIFAPKYYWPSNMCDDQPKYPEHLWNKIALKKALSLACLEIR